MPFGGSNTCDPSGGLPQVVCLQQALVNPTVQLWIGFTAHWHVPTLLGVQGNGSPQVNQNFVSRACKDHPPHRCSVSTCVAMVYTPHHKQSSACQCLAVQSRHYLHGLISHTTKSVTDLRFSAHTVHMLLPVS